MGSAVLTATYSLSRAYADSNLSRLVGSPADQTDRLRVHPVAVNAEDRIRVRAATIPPDRLIARYLRKEERVLARREHAELTVWDSTG
jgi:hypothetical protein